KFKAAVDPTVKRSVADIGGRLRDLNKHTAKLTGQQAKLKAAIKRAKTEDDRSKLQAQYLRVERRLKAAGDAQERLNRLQRAGNRIRAAGSRGVELATGAAKGFAVATLGGIAIAARV